MLDNRLYKPNPGDIIYHYCDPAAFHSICISRRFRFSELSAMNDFMELIWGVQVWEEACQKLEDKVGKAFLQQISNQVVAAGLNCVTTAACFSCDGDVLSQWRAYSNDGTGFSIGFDAEQLVSLPVRPLRVLYDKSEQVNEAEAFMRVIYEVEANEGFKFSEDFTRVCREFAFDLNSFKNPAFREEQEIRLTHLLVYEKAGINLRLSDPGGNIDGNKCAGEEVQFRMRGGLPIAFVDIDYSRGRTVNPIKKVIIGPKNETHPLKISIFLETIGLGGVVVEKSNASYR